MCWTPLREFPTAIRHPLDARESGRSAAVAIALPVGNGIGPEIIRALLRVRRAAAPVAAFAPVTVGRRACLQAQRG